MKRGEEEDDHADESAEDSHHGMDEDSEEEKVQAAGSDDDVREAFGSGLELRDVVLCKFADCKFLGEVFADGSFDVQWWHQNSPMVSFFRRGSTTRTTSNS
jgi:hypothetical protein